MPSPQFQTLYETLRAAPDRSGMSLEKLRAMHDERARQFPAPADVAWEAVDAGGAAAEWVRAPGSSSAATLLYFHGGGYYRGSAAAVREMVSRMSRASGVQALSVNYRLAPEDPFPAAVDDAVAAYRWLLAGGADPRRIVVGGDSAGGGLALALQLAVREAGEPLPGAAVCLSPWADLAQAGQSYATRADEDPSITKPYLDHAADMYLGGADAGNPLASPLAGDLSGLAPLLVQVGTAEVLLDDSTRLAAKAKAAGVEVELEQWEGMTHVWQNNGTALPEGVEAVERIGQFVRERTGA